MNRHEVLTLVAYDRWANRRLLGAARLLTPEAFARDLRASFGSVQGTLVHILWGESGWLRFWLDGCFILDFSSEDFPSVAALEARWTTLEEEQQAFVDRLTEDQLSASRVVDDYEYTLGELIQHTLNHSSYHRGQVVLLLRQLGETPPATDFRDFLTELRCGAA
jgi:uncharacterized damage-inducible protein DinB